MECTLSKFGTRDMSPIPLACRCNNVNLPKYCKHPSGDDCDWYKNCLEKQHTCIDTIDSYSIDYGLYFCNRYNEFYANFSNTGQKWTDAVRKCLQEKLVSFLQPCIFDFDTRGYYACRRIKKKAFDSHESCYISAGVCELHPLQWWKIFVTVYPAFQSLDVLKQTKQALLVFNKCVPRIQERIAWKVATEAVRAMLFIIDVTHGDGRRLEPADLQTLTDLIIGMTKVSLHRYKYLPMVEEDIHSKYHHKRIKRHSSRHSDKHQSHHFYKSQFRMKLTNNEYTSEFRQTWHT
ncbi:unnamed protein product [Adineta steineri]|uniref:Stanniocalcin-like protein n=1 Tax=Adineta steineri TaxID=433720 RepID=A0A820AGJ1_9BILA|nr:unnamed protein product [Adineta steineri]